MRSDTLAVRDRILAVLREAKRPMTTDEVGEAAGTHFVRFTCRGEYGPVTFHHHPDFYQCTGELDLMIRPLYLDQRCWRELARFEKAGLVTATREPGRRAILWWRANVLNEDASLFADLEARLAEGGVS